MQKGKIRKKVVSMPITIIQKVIVEACLGEELRRINRHGTKIIDVSVSYYEVKDAENKKYVNATCMLRKDGTIVWDFKEKCPIEVAKELTYLFPEEELTAYFEKLK